MLNNNNSRISILFIDESYSNEFFKKKNSFTKEEYFLVGGFLIDINYYVSLCSNYDDTNNGNRNEYIKKIKQNYFDSEKVKYICVYYKYPDVDGTLLMSNHLNLKAQILI